MKYIELTQGKRAIVDDEDYEELSKYGWYTYKHRHTWYASRHAPKPGGGQTTHAMHRAIMGLEHGDGIAVDHRNHDGLDNRRDNLRRAIPSQNQQNRRPDKRGASQYKGVSWHKLTPCWRAKIQYDNKTLHLGVFDNEIEAARAYDAAARKHFGEFACCNFPVI